MPAWMVSHPNYILAEPFIKTELMSRINFIDNSTSLADRNEVARIMQTLSTRISDFEENCGSSLFYNIILNPNKTILTGLNMVKQGVYIQINELTMSRNKGLRQLMPKFSLFRFDNTGINNILIEISDKEIQTPYPSIKSNITYSPIESELVSCLFNENIYRLISSIKEDNYNAFVCLVGNNLSGVDKFVKLFAQKVDRDILQVEINDVLKSNTLLNKIFAKEQHKIIYLAEFDFLFSDLNQTPKIANRELAMIRHDLKTAIKTNKTNTIIISVASPTVLTDDISCLVDSVENFTEFNYSAVKTLVSQVFGIQNSADSITNLLFDLPYGLILSILAKANGKLHLNPNMTLYDYIQSYINQHKIIVSEFAKVEGADFKIVKPSATLDRVVLSDDNREKLQMALSSIVNQNLVYNIWGFSEIDANIRSIINFYGPPGTGKTLCANAIAHELSERTGEEYSLLSLNYSEIESMYVGEAPKKLERVFNYAKDKKLVLFFDEADSFLGKRIQNVSQGSEQAINSLRSTMLIQLEKYTGVVIFATNLTSNYDNAFKTRFLAEIEFPLPDKETCKKIFKKNIPTKLTTRFANSGLTEDELDNIAQQLVGLSGRDIKTIIWRVLLRQSQKDGESHLFQAVDFESETKTYKAEKNSNPVKIDENQVTLSSTPASERLAEKLGLKRQNDPKETN